MNSTKIKKWESFTEIVNAIEKKREKISVIRAPTGSGKSTELVKILYEKGKTCFLVAPTIPSVRSLYKYMSNTIQLESIGYAADHEIKYDNSVINQVRNNPTPGIENTALVYCTTGHMKNILYDCILAVQKANEVGDRIPNIHFCDYIILDEVHIGSIDITMIQRLWLKMNQLFNSNSRSIPNLIESSATYSDDSIPTYELIDNSIFKVEAEYLTEDVMDINQTYAQIIGFINNYEEEDPGVWLVFLPGLEEIQVIKTNIDAEKYDIFTAHSSLSSEDMDKIFQTYTGTKRKLILATNIAETSLTIPNLSLIVDSMYEKIPITTPSGSLTLECVQISKDSATQRLGRTGRTCNGKVFRMCSIEQFDSLSKNRPLEITRLPIINESIRCITVGLDINEIFYDLDPIIIKECLVTLKDLDAIDINGIVTDLGKFVTKIPTSFRTAAFLYYWNLEYPIYPGIVLAMLIEMGYQFRYNYPKEIRSNVPLGTLINLWTFMVQIAGDINPSFRVVSEYTSKYNINLQHFLELKKKILELLSTFHRLGETIELIDFDAKDLYQQAHPILKSIYSSYGRTPKGGYIKLNAQKKRAKDTPFYHLDTNNIVESITSNPNIKTVVGFYTRKDVTVDRIILWMPYEDNFEY